MLCYQKTLALTRKSMLSVRRHSIARPLSEDAPLLPGTGPGLHPKDLPSKYVTLVGRYKLSRY